MLPAPTPFFGFGIKYGLKLIWSRREVRLREWRARNIHNGRDKTRRGIVPKKSSPYTHFKHLSLAKGETTNRGSQNHDCFNINDGSRLVFFFIQMAFEPSSNISFNNFVAGVSTQGIEPKIVRESLIWHTWQPRFLLVVFSTTPWGREREQGMLAESLKKEIPSCFCWGSALHFHNGARESLSLSPTSGNE